MTDHDMTDMETSDHEFMNNLSDENIVSDVESSDDEFHLDNLPFDYDNNDDEVNYEDHYSDSDSGSDILPPRRRRVIQLSSDDESVASDIVRNKVEENVFGDWYDVTENDYLPKIIPFASGMPLTGPQVPRSTKQPLDFFKLFFTDELIHNIVLETNKYATSKIIPSELRPRSTWRTWKPVRFDEMSAFIGVILNMGLIPLKNMQDYWSKESNLHIPFFSNTFRRERFLQIFWMLHLSENVKNQTTRTRTQKVNNFLKYIESKFQTYYVPTKNISIDESVVKFKGKISFITYNKNKPTKWGIRIYVLADASNGYVYSILPYYGSITTEILIRPELPVTSRIVLHLYTTLLNKLPNAEGYHIFCDRYYSSLTLASELLKLKCHFTGTINKNRKFVPKFIKSPQLTNPNRKVACRTNNMMLLAWQDKRIVNMITTYNTSESCQVTRKYYDGTIVTVSKPKVIVSYTKHMRGVDRADQLAASYCFLRKSFKWWRKLFFWGLEICSINSYTLYKITELQKNKIPMTHHDFVSTLVRQLVGNFREGSLARGRPSSTDVEERLNGKFHCNVKWQNGKKKDCLVCSKRNIKNGRHETRYFCETCIRKPGLHPGNCFNRYHTMKNYKM